MTVYLLDSYDYKKHRLIVKEKCPWFNVDIIRVRNKRRAAEKK